MASDLPSLSFLDVGGPVAFREWAGPPEITFVLIHGLGGSHITWVPVADGLSGLGRVLALDLPGFGWSPRQDGGSGLMQMRRVLSRFIATAGTGETVLCGNSMGGAIAVLQAAVEPGSVGGLVLTGSVFPWVPGGGRPHPAILAAFAIYDQPSVGERFVRARVRRVDPERMVRIGFGMVAADPTRIDPEVVSMTIEVARMRAADPDAARAFLEAARSLLRLGRRRDAAARTLDRLTAPVLVLHGRRDRLVPATFAERALRDHPTWRGRIFPGVGHAPQLEAPGRWLGEVADWSAEMVR